MNTRQILRSLKSLVMLLIVYIGSILLNLATAGEKSLAEQGEIASPIQLQQIWSIYQASLSIEEEKQIEALRLISIEERMDLLQGELVGESIVQVYLQIANLYFEEGNSLYYSEMTKNHTDIELCVNTLGCDVKSIKINNAKSKEYLNHSINFYKHVVSYAPPVSYADEALFYLGQALYDIGEADQAVATFQQLVFSYPQSRYIFDAYMFIGEYWFEKTNRMKPIEAYQYAVAYKNSRYHAFSMYKLAWCYYEVLKYDEAIESINLVINFLSSSNQSSDTIHEVFPEAINIKTIGYYIANIHKYEYTSNIQVNQFLLNAAQRDRELFNAARASKQTP